MMGKTHIAVGIATSYIILQPKTVPEIIAATVGGSIGGVMADVDVKIDTRNEFSSKATLDALYGAILAVILSISLLMSNYLTGGQIVQTIISHWPRAVIGVGLFAVFTVIGELSKHRDRTHSFVAWILFSISMLLIDVYIGMAFVAGYASHLIIDLLNKKPIRLFYPLEKGICLRLCYADKLGNEILLIVGTGIIAAYLVLYPFYGLDITCGQSFIDQITRIIQHLPGIG